MENIKSKKNDSITVHFNKYKSFYISVFFVSLILFIWCKYGKKILDYCFSDNSTIEKNTTNNQLQNNLQEIHNILSSMN